MPDTSFYSPFPVRILHPLPKDFPGIVLISGIFFYIRAKTAAKSSGTLTAPGQIPLSLPLTAQSDFMYASMRAALSSFIFSDTWP